MFGGSCPTCGHPVLTVQAAKVTVYTASGQWDGLKYYCPRCGAVLCCEIDPIALKADIVDEVTARVLKGLGR